MNLRATQFTHAGKHLMTAAALAVSLLCLPALSLAAGKSGHEDRALNRINAMHAQLKITPAQEDLWVKVAQTMSDNAKVMDTLTQARVDQANGMTAVDDLKSYGEITAAHADGIKTLTPAFASLYDSMSDAQKKEADTIFRHGGRQNRHGKQGSMGK